MRESGIVAQLAAFIARNAVNLANGSEHLRLFHSIHAEVRLKVEVEIQHVLGVAGLFDDQGENALFDGVVLGLARSNLDTGGRPLLFFHCRRG